MTLGSTIRIRLITAAGSFVYRATVTEISGKDVWVTLHKSGETRKLERRKCEIVEGEK